MIAPELAALRTALDACRAGDVAYSPESVLGLLRMDGWDITPASDLTALRAQVETLREALSGLIDWFDTNGIEDSRLDEARASVSRDDTSKVSDG